MILIIVIRMGEDWMENVTLHIEIREGIFIEHGSIFS